MSTEILQIACRYGFQYGTNEIFLSVKSDAQLRSSVKQPKNVLLIDRAAKKKIK